MCCNSEDKYVKKALQGRKPDDYMIGYKVFDVVQGIIKTPHRGYVIDPSKQVMRPLRVVLYPVSIRTQGRRDINEGAIHFYKMKESAKNISPMSGARTVTVRVYVRVSDIVGVDGLSAAAREVIIDFDDLKKLRMIAEGQLIK